MGARVSTPDNDHQIFKKVFLQLSTMIAASIFFAVLLVILFKL